MKRKLIPLLAASALMIPTFSAAQEEERPSIELPSEMFEAYKALMDIIGGNAFRGGEPHYGTMVFQTGASNDPIRARMKTGGPIYDACNDQSFYFSRRPDIDIRFFGEGDMNLFLRSQGEISLLVVPNDGPWEDGVCLNSARVSGSDVIFYHGQPGYRTYRIWVGSRQKDNPPEVELFLTERGPSYFFSSGWEDDVVDFGSAAKRRQQEPPQDKQPPAPEAEPEPEQPEEEESDNAYVIGMG